ncbi:MAG: putative bifunctional diguanylate cyclase/phosphodiesterase [Candidatus Weimeria sp.]
MQESDTVFAKLIKDYLSSENMSTCILGRDGKTVFKYFSDPEEEKRIRMNVSEDMLKDVSASFSDYDVSDVIDIPSDKSSRYRALASRDSAGKVKSVMFLFTENADDSRFDSVTRKISDSMNLYNDISAELNSLSDRVKQSDEERERLEHTRRMYKYLSMLIDEISFRVSYEDACEDIIKKSALCVNFDACLIVRGTDSGAQIEKQYRQEGNGSLSYINGLEKDKLPFMDGKIYTISSDSVISDEFREFFKKCGITAGIFMPLSEDDDIYLCFLKTQEPKTWNSDEVGFLRRAGAILKAKLEFRDYSIAVNESDDFMLTVFENSASAVAVFDAVSKEPVYKNTLAEKILGDPLNEEVFSRIFLIPGPSEDQKKMTGEFTSPGTGDIYQVHMTRAIQHGGQKVLVYMITDITKQKQYQKKLKETADIDDLTGLYNRHRFHRDLESSLNDARRGNGSGTLIFIDLDDFNALNDGLGHILADKFLKKTAWSIQQLVKKDAQCYRIGGDQFAVIIPYSDFEQSKQMALMINNRFEKPFSLDGNNYYCTAGMGVVNFPQDGKTEDELISRADFALHQAKAKGKNQVDIYTDIEVNMPHDRLNIEKALREAVADDCREFLVYYQPVVDISNGEARCCGAEALVRWDSHKLGFMPPAKFIALSEYLGLIIPIGEHVLLDACRTCHHWNEYGHPDYKINVNLSVLQLMQNDIVNVIANAINVTGIDPDNLVLEVTEGMAINDMDKMKGVLEKIHDLGVRIALDDFGTGYSSLSHMKDLPLDELKIDKCFVDDIDKDDYSDAFVRSVSQLADAVNLNVIVEGVERGKQQDVLKGMDVDMIQGFLYDKPLPLSEFESKWV